MQHSRSGHSHFCSHFSFTESNQRLSVIVHMHSEVQAIIELLSAQFTRRKQIFPFMFIAMHSQSRTCHKRSRLYVALPRSQPSMDTFVIPQLTLHIVKICCLFTYFMFRPRVSDSYLGIVRSGLSHTKKFCAHQAEIWKKFFVNLYYQQRELIYNTASTP